MQDPIKRYRTQGKVYAIPEKESKAFLADYPDAEEVVAYTVGDKKYNIPLSKVGEFLKDMPNAVPVDGVKKKEPTPQEVVDVFGVGSNGSKNPVQQPQKPSQTPTVTGKLKNFEKRALNPSQSIKNPDGTTSTHKMASAEVDGKYIAFPTIVEKDGKLVELSVDDAIDYALKNDEFRSFKTEKESQEYAEGGYKKGTPLEEGKPVRFGATGTGQGWKAGQPIKPASKLESAVDKFMAASTELNAKLEKPPIPSLVIDPANGLTNANKAMFDKLEAQERERNEAIAKEEASEKTRAAYTVEKPDALTDEQRKFMKDYRALEFREYSYVPVTPENEDYAALKNTLRYWQVTDPDKYDAARNDPNNNKLLADYGLVDRKLVPQGYAQEKAQNKWDKYEE